MLDEQFWEEYKQLISKTRNYLVNRSKIKQMEDKVWESRSYVKSDNSQFLKDKEFLQKNIDLILEYSNNLLMQSMILQKYSAIPRNKKIEELFSLQNELDKEFKTNKDFLQQEITKEATEENKKNEKIDEMLRTIMEEWDSFEELHRPINEEKNDLDIEKQQTKSMKDNGKTDISEVFSYINESLSSNEFQLFRQLNQKKIEELDNYFNDSWTSEFTEDQKYKNLCQNFTKQQIEKVEKLHEVTIFGSTGPYSFEKTGKIHVDAFEYEIKKNLPEKNVDELGLDMDRHEMTEEKLQDEEEYYIEEENTEEMEM